MSRIIVIYDSRGDMQCVPSDRAPRGLKQAMLDIPDDLEGKDIYQIARKLAEMLLEQI